MYKRSTITVCLINDAAYYTDINLDTFNQGMHVLKSPKLQKGRSTFCMQRANCLLGYANECGLNADNSETQPDQKG